MAIESYSQTHYGTKYPRRSKRKRRNEYDPKEKGKTSYQNTYGL
jgi:hypothetical protein